MQKNKLYSVLGFAAITGMVLAACAPAGGAAAPQVIEKTVVVEVTKVTTEEKIVVVTPTPIPTQLRDTIIIGAWQQPRGFLGYANGQAIRVEIDLIQGPRFVQLNNFEYKANPNLVEGDLPSLEKGGAELKEVTVKKGDPIFDVKSYRVISATADTPAKQLIVTGKIKSGLKWSDDQPLTANDAILAWTKNCEKDSEALDVTNCPLGSVDGAGGIVTNYEAKDETTLIVSYVPGALDPLYFLAPYGVYGFLPSHLFKDMTAADIAKDERANGGETSVPLSYGPYRMKEWKKNDRIVFEINPNWAGEKPKTPTIIYRFFADSTSLAAAVIAGEVDTTSATTGLSVDQAPYMESVAKKGIITYSTDPNAASFEMLYINYNDPSDKTFTKPHPVLSDYAVRKAISMALDRQKMVDTIYFGQSAVVEQPHLPQMVSYDPSLGKISFNIEEAKKLLDDAGWKDSDADGIREKNGVKASINYLTTSGNAPRQKASQVLQANLKEIGIDVKTSFQPSSVTFSQDGLYGRNFDLIQFANVFSVVDPGSWWFGVASCDQIPTPENQFVGSNYAGWCRKDSSEAVATAAYLSLDAKERKASWDNAVKAYFEPPVGDDYRTGGYPVIPLFTRPNYLATVTGLQGPKLDPTEYFTWNIETWTLTGSE